MTQLSPTHAERNRLNRAPVRRIVAPVWLGVERPGVDLGAETLSRGLEAAWTDQDRLLLPAETAPVAVPEHAETRANRGDLAFLSAIHDTAEAIAVRVAAAIAFGELAVTLGGDHSVALGSLAGAASVCERLGVLWIDAHLDMNTPETSPSGHIHGMPLAAALGYGPQALTGIRTPETKLLPMDVAIFGVRAPDAEELALVERERIWMATTEEWRADGIVEALDLALISFAARGIDAIHVSFDLDVVDPSLIPGVGTPVPGGLTMEEVRLALTHLRDWPGPIRSIDVVELNPTLDPSGASASRAIELLSELLGVQQTFVASPD